MSTANMHPVATSNDRADILALIHARHQVQRDKGLRVTSALFAKDTDAPVVLHPRICFNNIRTDEPDIWESYVELESRDLTIKMSHNQAVCRGLLRLSTIKKGRNAAQHFGMCETIRFERTKTGWRVVNEHTSGPFPIHGGSGPTSGSKLRVDWAPGASALRSCP